MGRSVDEDAAIKIVTYECGEFTGLAKEIGKQIKALPTAVQERPKGKWINAKCSACGNLAPFWPMASTYYHTNYCPNCGAEMREES